MPDCPFCKIIAGDIPAATVHEDDHTFAFLDINPLAEGHTLVMPKHPQTTRQQTQHPSSAT